MTKIVLSVPIYLRRFMKWTFIIVMFFITTLLTAKGSVSFAQVTLSTKVSVKFKNTTLKEALKVLSKQAKVDFAYNTKTLPLDEKVDLAANEETLGEVLGKLLSPLGLSYKVIGQSILIEKQEKKTESDKPAAATLEKPALTKISGLVVDESGNPLSDVTVTVAADEKTNSIKGNGVVTNGKGEFTVSADLTDIIKFSFTGYATQQMPVSLLPKPIIIRLKSALNSLDEVQIIGYGTTTQRLSTGSQVKISAADIEKSPVDNILLTLEGRVPGLQISQNSGVAGAAPIVKIRGTNSIAAGTSPLYILDGIPVPEASNSLGNQMLNGQVSNLLTINPSDIASIEVLKDADATSIYGSRGSNGVILITTKKGRGTGTNVNFTTYSGFSQVPHFVDFMDVHQYDAMRRAALANDGTPVNPQSAADLYWDTTQTHNWQKYLIGKNAPTTDAQVALSGGNEGTHFYINAGFHRLGTVTPGDGNNLRKSIRFSLDHSSLDRRFTISLIGGYSVNNLNLQTIDLTNSISLPPAFPLYNAEGKPNFGAQLGFPLAYVNQPFKNTQDAYNGQFSASYQPIGGLMLKLNASYNNGVTNETEKLPLSTLDPANNPGGIFEQGIYQAKSWIVEPQATYSLYLKKSTFNFLVGGTWQKNTGSNFTAQGLGYTNDALIGDLGSATNFYFGTTSSVYAYESGYARITYNYDEEYLVNGTFRRDGSSRFGPGNRYGSFGSIGLGWIFTKEEAVKKIFPFLSYGKIRGSYGTNGNDQVADYGYISTYYSIKQGYEGPSLLPSSLANANYRWEQNKKIDAAIELGFWDDRFLLKADLYRNRTDNQLIPYVVSPQTGFYSYEDNFPAKLQNQGIEIDLSTQNITSKLPDGFNWKTFFNITKSQNKLLSFPNIASSSYYSSLIVGKSINLIQGYLFTGLSNTGAIMLKDVNNDGNLDYQDYRLLGANDPFNAGLSNEFSYKHFSLSFLFDFNRLSGFNPSLSQQPAGAYGANQTVSALGAWMKAGDESKTSMPAYTGNYSDNYSQLRFSSYAYSVRNVFRLRNASLGYSIPQQVLTKLKIKQAQLYVRGENIWTSGANKNVLDPETGNSVLPPLRTLVLGINCSF